MLRRTNGTWAVHQHLIPPVPASTARFGVDVALTERYAVIGADGGPGDKQAQSGHAYVYELVNEQWVQIATLSGDVATPTDGFGSRVAISDRTIVVSAAADDVQAGNEGAVYVFQNTCGVWDQIAKLYSPSADQGDLFGDALALDGDTLVAGNRHDDTGGPQTGSAFVFERNGNGDWSTGSTLIPTGLSAGAQFGISVGVRGTRAIVGALLDTGNASQSGSVYVFERSDLGWQQAARLVAEDGASGDYFGFRVGLGDEMVIVGALFDDAPNAQSGSIYLFTRDQANSWGQRTKYTLTNGPANSQLSSGMGYDGTTIIGGEHDVAVFSLLDQCAVGPGSGDCDGDVNGDGAVDIDDLLIVFANWSG